jgi:hypothetical protein
MFPSVICVIYFVSCAYYFYELIAQCLASLLHFYDLKKSLLKYTCKRSLISLLSSPHIARTHRTYSEQPDTLSATTTTPAISIPATTAAAEAKSRQTIRATATATTRTEHIAEK